MTRALWVTVALIIYGSLYPFQLRPAMRAYTWPAHFAKSDLGDIAVNLFLYVPVGMFAFLALDRRRARWARWFAPVALCLLLSSLMEFMQIYDRTRVSSLLDVTCNTLGGIAGVVIGWRVRGSVTGAMLLVLYWLGYQICAVFAIAARLRPAPHPSLLDVIAMALAWLAVIWMLWKDKSGWAPQWSIAFACVFGLLLIVRGLAPFHWIDRAHPFLFTPFAAMFGANWISGLPVFLEKSFYYGTAIWLLRAAGLRLAAATTLVAATLLIIEILQRHLPGRTAEITDPLLALIGGYLLWQIESSAVRTQWFDTIPV